MHDIHNGNVFQQKVLRHVKHLVFTFAVLLLFFFCYALITTFIQALHLYFDEGCSFGIEVIDRF